VGPVTAALEAVQADDPDELPPGIAARIESLQPVIEAGLADDRVSAKRDASLVNQLVEYNIDRQVEFLRTDESVPDTERVLGFVYDFQGVYGDDRGRCYLVNHGGETAIDRLREAAPERFEPYARRLL